MMKVYLKFTEGACWRRVLDIKLVEHFFEQNGCEIVGEPKVADLIILETCAFVKRTEDIAMQEIEDIIGSNYKGKLLVIGCLPGINLPRLRQVFDGIAINTADLEQINDYFPEFKYKLGVNSDVNVLYAQKNLQSAKVTFYSLLRHFISSINFKHNYFHNVFTNFRKIMKAGMGLRRKVYYIRIGWGCEERCTYCVEWRAVGGKFVSKPLDVCLEEVKNGRSQGYKNFVILADSPGQWGGDLGKKFPDLLRAILDVDHEITIANIDGIHPHSLWQYQDEFLELLETRRIKSIMSPLQSGNDRILNLMKRRYSKQQFVEMMQKIKSAYPDMVLITQVIVGFPSETFDEFKESVEVVTDLGFTNATFFPYYSNPLTVSHGFKGKIDDQEKFQRVEYALKELGRQGILSANFGVEINPKYQKTKALYD